MIIRKTSEYPIVCTAVFLALVIGYLLSVLGPLVPAALVICIFLAVVAFFWPRFSFYALLASSMFSRYELPVGGTLHLRPDQIILVPLLAGVALRFTVTSLGYRYQINSRSRASAAPIIVFVGLVLYIVINALSSYLYSPQPTESYKIVVWLLLSFSVFAATYFIVDRYVSVREAFFALLGLGFASGGLGILLFALFQLTGATLGIQQDPDTKLYSALGTFPEANIFGSFQAFSAIVGIAVLHLRQVQGRAFRWVATGTFLSCVALALSFTRAAWLALFAGVLILVFFQFRGGRFLSLLLRLGISALIALLALASTGLLTNLTSRFVSITDFTSGTVAYRLERFNVALTEWASSPILGLGTNSYGQRHLDPTQNYAPDYLPSLFISTLYDVGPVGLLILLTVFGVVTGALIQTARRTRGRLQGDLALALLCGMVGFLISYQATSAFWYSYNWIIMAIALKLCRIDGERDQAVQSPFKRLPSRRSAGAL